MTASPWLNAWTQSGIAPLDLASVEIVNDSDGLRALHAEFRRWSEQRHLPTTATDSWIFADIGASEDIHAWAVAARDPQGAFLGAVLLLDEVVDGQAVTSLAGTDQGNRGVLTLESPEVAEEIARHVAAAMLNRLEPSRLVLGPLDTNDPRVHAFTSALPGAQLVAVDPIPVIEQVEPDARAYLSQGMRRTLRKAKNRLDKDGHEMTVLFTKCPHEIGSVVPQLEQVHRDRDHVHGRPSDLDDDRGRRLWRIRLRQLAASGNLELATLHIDGQFAAHALGATDHPTYRVLEGRFVTDWARYAPGRLLEAAVLQRVLDDEMFSTLDWMTSVAPEKLLATNAADPMVLIHWIPTR